MHVTCTIVTLSLRVTAKKSYMYGDVSVKRKKIGTVVSRTFQSKSTVVSKKCLWWQYYPRCCITMYVSLAGKPVKCEIRKETIWVWDKVGIFAKVCMLTFACMKLIFIDVLMENLVKCSNYASIETIKWLVYTSSIHIGNLIPLQFEYTPLWNFRTDSQGSRYSNWIDVIELKLLIKCSSQTVGVVLYIYFNYILLGKINICIRKNTCIWNYLNKPD